MDRKTMECPHCGAQIPEGSKLCPQCGKKIRPKMGKLTEEMTDEQIKRIRRPLTVITFIILLIVIYFKYFKNA